MGNKIQKIYVGQNQVWPKPWQGLNYYIDFRTAGSLPSDWTATIGGTVNSNGLVAESTVWKEIDLSGASSIAITVTGQRNNSSNSWMGADNVRLREYFNGGKGYMAKLQYKSNYTYNSEGSRLLYYNGSSDTLLTKVTGKTPNGGSYTYTYNVNLSTGAWTVSQYDSGSGYTNNLSYTLSASQIAEMKTFKYFQLNITNPNSLVNYCRTVAIDIT